MAGPQLLRRPIYRTVTALVTTGALLASGQVAVAASPDTICDDAEPPPLVEPVELCGVTTITGDGTGMIRVFTPTDAVLRLSIAGVTNVGPDKPNEVTGTGTVTGFMIAADVPERDGPALVFARLPESFAILGGDRYAWNGFGGYGAHPSSITLPAGSHLLYLLTSGGPASVRLTLEGLTGGIALTPARSTGLDLRGPMTPHLPCSPPACPLYNAGETGTLRSKGFGFMSFVQKHTSNVLSPWGLCNYNGDPGPGAVAYLPPCPIIPQSDLLAIVPSTSFGLPSEQRIDELWGPLPAGDYGMGAWAVTGGALNEVGTIAFFASFD